MPSSPKAGASRIERADDLLSMLARVPDPRDPRGVRYPLAGLLAVAVSAVVAGARSFAAIGEWAADLPAGSLAVLGLNRAPETSNLRKLLARVDPEALDRQIGSWLWTRLHTIGGRRVIAIDGKTVRGARLATMTAPHLVGAFDHASGVVVGQRAVNAKSNEIPAVRDLLAGFDQKHLATAVITADAMHTQTDTATAITTAGADAPPPHRPRLPQPRQLQATDAPHRRRPQAEPTAGMKSHIGIGT